MAYFHPILLPGSPRNVICNVSFKTLFCFNFESRFSLTIKGNCQYFCSPKEFSSGGSQFQDPGSDGLSLHHGRGVDELVLLEVPAGDPHGHGGLSGWDDHPNAGVATTPHGPASCVDHETDEKPKNISTFVRFSEIFQTNKCRTLACCYFLKSLIASKLFNCDHL